MLALPTTTTSYTPRLYAAGAAGRNPASTESSPELQPRHDHRWRHRHAPRRARRRHGWTALRLGRAARRPRACALARGPPRVRFGRRRAGDREYLQDQSAQGRAALAGADLAG